jgi:hypothetical protein
MSRPGQHADDPERRTNSLRLHDRVFTTVIL